MASSGPTRAIDSAGERCHSTTSISAADAISANGAVVCRAFSQATLRNGVPMLAETIPLISTRLKTQ